MCVLESKIHFKSQGNREEPGDLKVSSISTANNSMTLGKSLLFWPESSWVKKKWNWMPALICQGLYINSFQLANKIFGKANSDFQLTFQYKNAG